MTNTTKPSTRRTRKATIPVLQVANNKKVLRTTREVRDSDPAERLMQLAWFLKTLPPEWNMIPPPLVNFTVQAIESFLGNDTGTLDHAFGFKEGTGRRGRRKQQDGLEGNANYQAAKKASHLIIRREIQIAAGHAPISWGEICLQSGFVSPNATAPELFQAEKELPKYWERYGERILAEQIEGHIEAQTLPDPAK